MKITWSAGAALLTLAALMSGCAAKQSVKADPGPQPAAHAAIPPLPGGHYVVRKGDSLWRIASRSTVLGDPLRWPLLYRANRDQIEDPDIITPLENLAYQRQYSEAEIADAVDKAKETPKYVPHALPRKTLPVQY